MCILCDMNYSYVCSLIKESIHGLTIQNCENIEEITLPQLRSLTVRNCPNLHTIHCQVTHQLLLEDLPELVTVEVTDTFRGKDVEPRVETATVSYCPKLLLPTNCYFSSVYYEVGCTLAHKKFGKHCQGISLVEIFRYEGEEGFSIQAHGFETQAIYTLQNL